MLREWLTFQCLGCGPWALRCDGCILDLQILGVGGQAARLRSCDLCQKTELCRVTFLS